MALARGVAYPLDVPFATTGLTVTATVRKDGGAFVASTNAVAESGTTAVYLLTLTAAEMTADKVSIRLVPSTGTALLATLVTDAASVAATIADKTGFALTAVYDPAKDTAATNAAAVRTNLATELARIDTNVASRNAVTPPTAEAIAIATEGHLLNEVDGAALLNAIVTAINTADVDVASLSVTAIASEVINRLLVTPANKLATDATGRVTPSIVTGATDTSMLATEANATTNRNTITTAITNKAVTAPAPSAADVNAAITAAHPGDWAAAGTGGGSLTTAQDTHLMSIPTAPLGTGGVSASQTITRLATVERGTDKVLSFDADTTGRTSTLRLYLPGNGVPALSKDGASVGTRTEVTLSDTETAALNGTYRMVVESTLGTNTRRDIDGLLIAV